MHFRCTRIAVRNDSLSIIPPFLPRNVPCYVHGVQVSSEEEEEEEEELDSPDLGDSFESDGAPSPPPAGGKGKGKGKKSAAAKAPPRAASSRPTRAATTGIKRYTVDLDAESEVCARVRQPRRQRCLRDPRALPPPLPAALPLL